MGSPAMRALMSSPQNIKWWSASARVSAQHHYLQPLVECILHSADHVHCEGLGSKLAYVLARILCHVGFHDPVAHHFMDVLVNGKVATLSLSLLDPKKELLLLEPRYAVLGEEKTTLKALPLFLFLDPRSSLSDFNL
ncbi:hypothetical protein VNO77_04249 [Canavalia gladiata]|uniref:Uncharacterized protein n=1 Tax=Canavalia gladiata TaxID=3824 RepID=A0AAN9MX12_CANGL